VYRASSGLLLNPISHRSFDSLEWSIYPKVSLIVNYAIISITTDSTLQDGVYFVHFFVRTEFSELHGKIINRDRFRYNSEDELPNPKLLAWHYAQCVRGHIRGFSAQFPTVAEQAEALSPMAAVESWLTSLAQLTVPDDGKLYPSSSRSSQ